MDDTDGLKGPSRATEDETICPVNKHLSIQLIIKSIIKSIGHRERTTQLDVKKGIIQPRNKLTQLGVTRSTFTLLE